jgi:hypothetical protein
VPANPTRPIRGSSAHGPRPSCSEASEGSGDRATLVCLSLSPSTTAGEEKADDDDHEHARQMEHQPANVLPLTCGTREFTIAPSARRTRERAAVPSGAAACLDGWP